MATGWLTRHGHQLSRAALLWLCSIFWVSVAQADVSVTVAVSVESGALLSNDDGAISARVRWLGSHKESPLVREPNGVWTAVFSGPQARALGIELWRTDTEPHRRISQSLEVVPIGDATIAYAMSKGGDDAAWRLSQPISIVEMRALQERSAMVGAVWVMVATMIVLLLGRRALARSDTVVTPKEFPPSYEFLGWLIVAIAWTWPAAWSSPDIVGRHFDAMGTVWVIDSASRLGLNLHDTFSGWPNGITYSAVDSWLLILFSWVGGSESPQLIHGWLGVLGVATSAFAASRFARIIGASSPAHLLAGLLFAGSGLVAAALLEGHVYQVVNPWMPWMAMFLHRASRQDGHWEHGLLAGLCFAAALFSSGYLGVSAGIVAVGLGLYGLKQAHNRRPLLVAAVMGICASVLFVLLFSNAGLPAADHATMDTLRMGSLSLNSIGAAMGEADRAHHSWALALSATMIALAALGVRSGLRGGTALVAISLVAMVIAMGPEWALGIAPDEARMPSVFSPLWDLPETRFLRFPGRIMWAALLPLSALAAVGLSVLMTRLGWKPMAFVVGLVIVETVVSVRLPARQVVRSGATPDAYLSAQGAVFDVVGEGISSSREADAWLNALLCQYQTRHGRPIAEDCVSVGPGSNPRTALSRWVVNRLYEGNAEAVVGHLRSMNFTALAVHYDWVAEADAERLKKALEQMPGISEVEQGDGVTVYPFHDEGPMESTLIGPAKKFVGPGATKAFEWPLRVDLIMDKDHELARYFVEIGTLDRMELKDKGTVPAAQYEDGLFTLRKNLIVEGNQDVRLIEIDEGRNRVLWSGTVVPFDGAEDRLSFHLDKQGGVSPILRSMDIHSPEVRSRRGKIMGLGWLASFVLMGLWWIRIRKDQLEPQVNVEE